MNPLKYSIPEVDPSSEAAREDYERIQSCIDMFMHDANPLPSSAFEDDGEDDEPHGEWCDKRKKKLRKAKKHEKRALDLLEEFDWKMNGAPKTPKAARDRRKELKRKIRGKQSKTIWGDF